jgi:hypothetical protein
LGLVPRLKPSREDRLTRDRIETLSKLPLRSLDDLLETLCRATTRHNVDPSIPPTLGLSTYHLRTGVKVSGVSLRMDSVGSERLLLLYEPGDQNDRPYGVAFIPVSSIAAVTVHDARPLIVARAPATSPLERTSTPPSPLELKRKFSSLETALSRSLGQGRVTLEWPARPETAEHSRALADLADALVATIYELGADTMARDALKEKLREVSIKTGERASAAMAGQTFRIVVTKTLDEHTRTSLRGALEQGL